MSKPKASWVPADKNRFGVPVLDLISITGSMLSTSSDPERAAMSMSWDGKPVGELALALRAHETLQCRLRYRAERDLPAGWLFTPTKMEEKWAIAYRDGSIWLIRSWTGDVNAVGVTRRDGDDVVVERIELADDALALFGDRVQIFDWIIRSHALREVLPLPVDRGGAEMLENVPLSVFGPFGHVAVCAATTWNPPPQTQPLRSCSDVATAVRLGDAARIAKLADARASLDSRAPVGGYTPLCIAAIKTSVELTRLLLERGADPNVLADREQSVLILAVVHGASEALLDLLVAHGADIHRANADGFGLVHAIAETDRPAYLPWAIAHGLGLEARTRRGHVPLHIAAGLGHVAALRALVAAGADRDARDPSGMTARDIAVAEAKPDAVAALDALG